MPQLSRVGLLASTGLGGAGGFSLDFDSARGVTPATTSFLRASGATLIDVVGNLIQVGANVPRFGPTGLVVEGSRVGSATNPAAEGLVPGRLGAGGSLPTGWTTGAITGMTIDVAAAVENGMSAVDLTITPTGAGGARVTFETLNATPGVVSTLSLFARLVAGPIPASVTALLARTVDLPSGNLSPSTSMLAMTGAALSSQRWPVTRAADATATQGRHEIAVATSGAGSAFTIRVALPDIESGASFASTPIPAPPPGGPYAPRTREADLWTAPLSALRIPQNGACTVLWRGRLDTTTGTGQPQTLVALDNGTLDSRYDLRIASTGVPSIARVRPSVSFAAATVGSTPITAGTAIVGGLTVSGAGRVSGSFQGFNGGVPVALVDGPTNGLTTMRFGHTAGSIQPMFGAISRIQVIPRAISDVELQARVAAF